MHRHHHHHHPTTNIGPFGISITTTTTTPQQISVPSVFQVICLLDTTPWEIQVTPLSVGVLSRVARPLNFTSGRSVQVPFSKQVEPIFKKQFVNNFKLNLYSYVVGFFGLTYKNDNNA